MRKIERSQQSRWYRTTRTVISNQSSLAQIGIYLLLEGLDLNLKVVNRRSIGKVELSQRLLDRRDGHLKLVQVGIYRALPILCQRQMSRKRGEDA